MTTTESISMTQTPTEGTPQPDLRRESNGHLTFVPGDGQKPVKECRVARCFPWSMPERFISIRNKDGNELHLFDSIEDVPEGCRPVVTEELGAQEFVPRILRVHEIDDTFEIIVWKADTDRGPVEFQVKDDEDVRALTDDCIVIRDHTGMLFEIPDIGELDERSRALVEDRLS